MATRKPRKKAPRKQPRRIHPRVARIYGVAATSTACFGDLACAHIRTKIAYERGIPEDNIGCDTRLEDLGYDKQAVAGLAPYINAWRAERGLPPVPMAKVQQADTVEDLCKLTR